MSCWGEEYVNDLKYETVADILSLILFLIVMAVFFGALQGLVM